MIKDTPYNEKELLALVAQGNELAFSKLFYRYKDKIYTIVIKLSRSTTLAEEVVQDVFLQIWLRREHLSDIKNFNAYLAVIARNRVYKILKQSACNYKVSMLNEQEPLLADNNSDDLLMEKEYNLLLQKAISRLPYQQKQVYQCIKEEGLKREEAAALLRLSPETVKFHLAQAMKNIRNFCKLHLDILTIFIFLSLIE